MPGISTGYSWSKWTVSAGTSPASATTNGTTVTIGANTTLVANATINSYTVTCEDWFVDGSNNRKVKLGSGTKSYNYGSSVNGNAWGSDTTLSKYYSYYQYKSSTSATVGTSGATVYRYFWAWSNINVMNPAGSEVSNGTVAKFSVSYNGASYVTGQSNETQASIILPYNATIKIKDIAMQQTYYELNNVTWAGSAISASSGVYTATVTTAAKSININVKYKSYYLDLNGLLDGTSSGNISGFGTADVYINGSLKSDNCTDYYTAWPYGTTYEIKDIKATTGHTYNGVSSGAVSGTIGAGNVGVQLKFTTNSYTVTCEDWFVDGSNNRKTKLGSATKSYKYNTTANGSDWGSSTSLGAYYGSYQYKSSTSATVGTSGATVYRYFWAWSNINVINPAGAEKTDGSVAKFSVSYNGASYVTGQSNETQASIILPYGATIKIKDIAMQQTYYELNNVTWAGSAIAASSGVYTATVTTVAKSININVKYKKYYFDVNPDSGIASFDIQVNGGTKLTNQTDYYQQLDYGSTAVITNVKAKTGYTYSKYTASGTMSASGAITSISLTLGAGNGAIALNSTINSYTNTISHWTWGYKNSEGNNGNKNAYSLGNTTFVATYNSQTTLDASKATTVPKGFQVRTSFGTSSIDGSWKSYAFGTKVTQKPNAMSFEYDYDPITYNITYTMNGGTNNSSNPSTYNVLYGVTFGNPTKTGYTFDGWYIGNTKVTGINPGKNASFTSADNLRSECNARTVGNQTVEARWKVNSYTVTYNFNGGVLKNPSSASAIITSQTVSETYDAKYKLTTTPFKPGYTFAGWFTAASGGTQVTTSTTVNITAAQTLYAHWNINNYTLTVNPNGGSWGNSTASQNFTQNYNTTKTIDNPTRTDYTFRGWVLTKQIDGNTFVELLYQAPGYAGFTNEAGAKSANELYKYSQLGQIEKFKYNGKYEFAILADENGKYYRWSQTSNPLTTTAVTGYANISNGFGGLMYNNTSTLLAVSTASNNWWEAIGQYGTGTNPISNADGLWTYKPVHFYVREANNLSNMYENNVTGALNSSNQYIFRDENVTLTAIWSYNNYKVGDNFYQTFENAYNALGSSGGTIKLEQNVTESNVATIGKNINLDLQNNTLTLNGVQLTVNSSGSLTIVGGTDGKIVRSNDTPIVNNGGYVRIGSTGDEIKNYPTIEGSAYAITGGFNMVGGLLVGTNDPPHTGVISLEGRDYTEVVTEQKGTTYQSRIRVEVVGPDIEIRADKVTITNQDVILNVRITDGYSGVKKATYTLNGRVYNLTLDNTGYGIVTVDQNQEVVITAEDRAGNLSSESYVVENIDKHPEDISSIDIENLREGTASNILVVFKDITTTDDSNITKIAFSNTRTRPASNSSDWIPYNINMRAPWTLDFSTGNGEKTVYMWIEDTATNISTVPFEKTINLQTKLVGQSRNKVGITFAGTDKHFLKSSLQDGNIAFKINNNFLNLGGRVLEILDNAFEYEGLRGIKYLSTLTDISGAGRIDMIIDEDTLHDKAGNGNKKQTIETDYYVDTNAPSLTIDSNGVVTVSDGENNLAAITVNGVLVSRDGTGIGVVPVGGVVKAYDKAGNVTVRTR